MALCAVLAYFSPVDYRRPRELLAASLAWLAAERVPTVVAQVVRPGQRPARIPQGIPNAVYTSGSCLLWKENLWNLAASLTPADQLAFVDADVRLPPGWAAAASEALVEADVVQPYSLARWLGRDGQPILERPATAVAIRDGLEPRPDRYHPGFAWCLTRQAFGRLGGWYDRQPAGGGDFAWAYALDRRWPSAAIRQHLPIDSRFFETPSYLAYQARSHAIGLRVACLEGVAEHLWHGDWRDRHYLTRCDYMPQPDESGEYPLVRRPDGLLEWERPEHAAMARRYWLARLEDGR